MIRTQFGQKPLGSVPRGIELDYRALRHSILTDAIVIGKTDPVTFGLRLTIEIEVLRSLRTSPACNSI